MRRQLFALSMLVALLAGATGCGDDGEADTATDGGQLRDNLDDPDNDGADPSAGSLSADLVGRTFLSESVTEDGDDRPLVAGTQIQLQFLEDGAISASAGCNNLHGPVATESGRIVVSDLPITDMACEPFSLHDQDLWLADFLLSGPVYTVEDSRLTLEGGRTVIELVGVVDEPVTPSQSLPGTTWRLTGFIDGDTPDSPVSSVPGEVVATITFEENNVGFSIEDCNTGGGDAGITESVIVIEQMIMTMIFCEQPARDVEAAIVAVLDGEITYEVVGGTLTLVHPRGKGLTLRPDE